MADYFDVDPAVNASCICECCGWDVESQQGCQCPECPTCGEQGNPKCYESSQNNDGSRNEYGHNMEYNDIQRYGMSKRREMEKEDAAQAQAQYEDWKESQELTKGWRP